MKQKDRKGARLDGYIEDPHSGKWRNNSNYKHIKQKDKKGARLDGHEKKLEIL